MSNSTVSLLSAMMNTVFFAGSCTGKFVLRVASPVQGFGVSVKFRIDLHAFSNRAPVRTEQRNSSCVFFMIIMFWRYDGKMIR